MRQQRRAVDSVLDCLAGMFAQSADHLQSLLIDYVVTHWRGQVHIGGAYTYCPRGATMGDVCTLRAARECGGRLVFAGEHCATVGFQCTNGAAASGVKSGLHVVNVVRRCQD